MRIEIFVTDEDVQNHFHISRDDTLSDDEYQKRCDDVELYRNDITIGCIETEKDEIIH